MLDDSEDCGKGAMMLMRLLMNVVVRMRCAVCMSVFMRVGMRRVAVRCV